MEKTMKTENEILASLQNFYGTTAYYQMTLYPNVLATDGIKYLAEQCKCFWLVDLIAATLNSSDVYKDDGMAFFKLIRNDDSSLTILVDDGNDNLYKTIVISTTDFPLDNFTIYAGLTEVNEGVAWVIMLPSEY
jgi:hypothetical protein